MGVYEDLAKQLVNEGKQNIKEAAKEFLDDCNEGLAVKTGANRNSGHLVETSNGVEVVWDADHSAIRHEMPESSDYKWTDRNIARNKSKYEKIIGGEDK